MKFFLQILGHVSIKESYLFLFHLHYFMYRKCSKVDRRLLKFQFLSFSLRKSLLRTQETGTKVPLGAKRSKKPVSYLLYNFLNNSKMLTVSLARIGQIFPAIFSEKYIFLVFSIFLYILKIRKIKFSGKIAGKVWPILANDNVSIFELFEKFYNR